MIWDLETGRRLQTIEMPDRFVPLLRHMRGLLPASKATSAAFLIEASRYVMKERRRPLPTIVSHWGVSTWVPQYAGQVATRAGYTAGRWGALAGLLYSVGGIAGYLVLGMLGDLWGRKPTIWLFFAGSVVVALAPFLIDDDLVLFMATPFAAPETRGQSLPA